MTSRLVKIVGSVGLILGLGIGQAAPSFASLGRILLDAHPLASKVGSNLPKVPPKTNTGTAAVFSEDQVIDYCEGVSTKLEPISIFAQSTASGDVLQVVLGIGSTALIQVSFDQDFNPIPVGLEAVYAQKAAWNRPIVSAVVNQLKEKLKGLFTLANATVVRDGQYGCMLLNQGRVIGIMWFTKELKPIEDLSWREKSKHSRSRWP